MTDAQERLRATMRDAGEAAHRAFEMAFDPGSGAVESWVDTKTLFAVRR